MSRLRFLADRDLNEHIVTGVKRLNSEPLEPPPVSPARCPPTDWGELLQALDDRHNFQASPDELPVPAYVEDGNTGDGS